MAASRGVMSSWDSPVLYLCGETRYPFPLDTRVCVLSIGERRPLSLLIKPNRNRKAESKLHNYTGLRLSLTPTYMAFTYPSFSLSLSVFLPSFFDTFFYLAAFFRALKSFLFSLKIERIMMLQVDQHAC